MRAPLISPFRRVSPDSITTQPLQSGDNLRGATLMCLSMLGFGCNDTVMKFVTQEMPLYQAITLRGMLVMAAIALLARRQGGLRLRIARPERGAMALRVLGEVGSLLAVMPQLISDKTSKS